MINVSLHFIVVMKLNKMINPTSQKMSFDIRLPDNDVRNSPELGKHVQEAHEMAQLYRTQMKLLDDNPERYGIYTDQLPPLVDPVNLQPNDDPIFDAYTPQEAIMINHLQVAQIAGSVQPCFIDNTDPNHPIVREDTDDVPDEWILTALWWEQQPENEGRDQNNPFGSVGPNGFIAKSLAQAEEIVRAITQMDQFDRRKM